MAQGKTSDASHTEAGYKPNRKNATRLKSNKDIQARIAELQSRVVDNIVLSRQWVLDRLIENAKGALADKDRGAANRALELLGKDIGMFVERSEHLVGHFTLEQLVAAATADDDGKQIEGETE